VAGVAGFAVTVSGDANGNAHAPKWVFLAQSDQRWVASTDGSTLVPLYDPAATAGSTGFFINVPATRTVKVSTASFVGSYNTFAGLAFSDGASDGGCSYVLGIQTCTKNGTSFSQTEYLLDGVGPVGFKMASSISFGGTTPGFSNNSTTIELIGTSLLPANGMVIKSPPWTPEVALPIARSAGVVASAAGKIHLYGGTSDDAAFSGSRVDVYDPATRTWTQDPVAPVSLTGWSGAAVGARAVFFKADQGYVTDPATGTWTATAVRPDSSSVLSVAAWTHADGTQDAVVVTQASSSTYGVWLYSMAAGSWTTIGSMPATNGDSFATAVVADTLYLVGGRAGVNVLPTIEKVDLAAQTYDVVTATLSHALRNVAIATIGTTLYVIDGANSGVPIPVLDVFDTTTGKITAGPANKTGRSGAAATAIGSKVYLLGGQVSTGKATTSIEVFNP
jgi:hypothetical protein